MLWPGSCAHLGYLCLIYASGLLHATNPNPDPNPDPNQAAYYTLLAPDGSLLHTDWNQTQLLGPNHPERSDGWNASDLNAHVPACPLPPEHMRWPTPREQEAELVRRRAEWAREHPIGFPAQCRKRNTGISTEQIVLIVICGTLVLFVVVVNWFLIRRQP